MIREPLFQVPHIYYLLFLISPKPSCSTILSPDLHSIFKYKILNKKESLTIQTAESRFSIFRSSPGWHIVSYGDKSCLFLDSWICPLVNILHLDPILAVCHSRNTKLKHWLYYYLLIDIFTALIHSMMFVEWKNNTRRALL